MVDGIVILDAVDGVLDVSVNFAAGNVENDVKGLDEVCLVNDEGP